MKREGQRGCKTTTATLITSSPYKRDVNWIDHQEGSPKSRSRGHRQGRNVSTWAATRNNWKRLCFLMRKTMKTSLQKIQWCHQCLAFLLHHQNHLMMMRSVCFMKANIPLTARGNYGFCALHGLTGHMQLCSGRKNMPGCAIFANNLKVFTKIVNFLCFSFITFIFWILIFLFKSADWSNVVFFILFF